MRLGDFIFEEWRILRRHGKDEMKRHLELLKRMGSLIGLKLQSLSR